MDEKRQKEATGFAGLSSLVSEVEIKPPRISAQEEAEGESEPAFLRSSASANASANRNRFSSMSEVKRQNQQSGSAKPETTTSFWSENKPEIVFVLCIFVFFAFLADIDASQKKSSHFANKYPARTQVENRSKEFLRCEATLGRYDRFRESETGFIDRCRNYLNSNKERVQKFKKTMERLHMEEKQKKEQKNLQSATRDKPSTKKTIQKIPEPIHNTPDPTVLEIQRKLNELGYASGTPDGFMGKKTRQAIIKFQKAYAIDTTGKADQTLLKQLNHFLLIRYKILIRRQTDALDSEFPESDQSDVYSSPYEINQPKIEIYSSPYEINRSETEDEDEEKNEFLF
jgi:hypothetical protein